MRNLVTAVVGDTSIHNIWMKDKANFDTFIIYYGDGEDKYIADGKYYDRSKGTKFRILHDMITKHPEIFSEYDAVFVPDDDLYMTPESISKFFDIFHEYHLQIAQPSIIGWFSVPITAHIPFSKLRYVNWVEIMCPCFTTSALFNCSTTFLENKSNWGIEFLWDKILGSPKKEIAIVDSVIAVHTRPCFYGDTYWNNDNTFDSALNESNELLEKHGIDRKYVVYETIQKDIGYFMGMESQMRITPDLDILKSIIPQMRLI